MKNIYIYLIIISGIVVMLIPITHNKNQTGIIIQNLDKTMIFFIPLKNLKFDLCNNRFTPTEEMKGFQFGTTIENYNQILRPKCHIVTTTPGLQYGLQARSWYLGKCRATYSYRESIFHNLKSMFNLKQFSIKVNTNFNIEFRYIERWDLDSITIEELK